MKIPKSSKLTDLFTCDRGDWQPCTLSYQACLKRQAIVVGSGKLKERKVYQLCGSGTCPLGRAIVARFGALEPYAAKRFPIYVSTDPLAITAPMDKHRRIT